MVSKFWTGSESRIEALTKLLEVDKVVKEQVIEMLEYSENMADRCNEKGSMNSYNYWKGKVTAYQNVLDILREDKNEGNEYHG